MTQADFAISEEISGVNMRLTAGGIRELHWHLASEWAYMSYGNCRVTVFDEKGRMFVSDVKEGDIWFFPAGLPHSLQGTGSDGCEFIIAFDDGKANEFNTLLVTDWLAHTPPEILAENFGVPADSFSKIPLHNRWIFQGRVPGDLTLDQTAVRGPNGVPPYPFTFYFGYTNGWLGYLPTAKAFEEGGYGPNTSVFTAQVERDVTEGVTGGVGTEVGGTRNYRQGTGVTGGDIGNRPE